MISSLAIPPFRGGKRSLVNKVNLESYAHYVTSAMPATKTRVITGRCVGMFIRIDFRTEVVSIVACGVTYQ